jgi:hypothetical protein
VVAQSQSTTRQSTDQTRDVFGFRKLVIVGKQLLIVVVGRESSSQEAKQEAKQQPLQGSTELT